MRVLVACEFSGIVRDAFAARGHDAWSCDLLPTERPGNHIQGDVLEVLDDGWDLMIAHPPCTFIANSGVSWLYKDYQRWANMAEGSVFFKTILAAPIEKVAVENPIPHKHAMQIINQKYDQVIQPYQFGHTESKATCLWLKNLPPLTPTDNVEEKMRELPKNEQQRLHYLPPSPERAKLRSTTFEGIAKAMAEQWG